VVARAKTIAPEVPTAAKRLREIAKTLTAHLKKLDPERGRELCRWILRLDDAPVEAHATLGHVLVSGVWMDPEMKPLVERRKEIQLLIQQSRRLEVKLEVGESTLAVLREIDPRPGTRVRFRNLVVHGGMGAGRLERIVREALRACALSQKLRGGKLAVPQQPVWEGYGELVLLDSRDAYHRSVELAFKKGWIEAKDAERLRDRSGYDVQPRDAPSLRILYDPSQVSSTSGLVADFSWGWRQDMFSGYIQSCLVAGHTNWVCLSLIGVGIPIYSITKTDAPTMRPVTGSDVHEREREEMRELAKAGIRGSRSWMSWLAGRGEDPLWSRSWVDQMGKITGDDLLKCTLVAEYLQERGDLVELMAKSLLGTEKDPPQKRMEEALKAPDELERRWRRWLLPWDRGLAQRLDRGDATAESPEEAAVLAQLDRLRGAAWSEDAFGPYRSLKLDRSLSDGARRHARYLTLNPKQVEAWPDAHEELPEHQGFSPEGCWAGMHSVIAPGVKSSQEAIDAWMGTFYHRIPLIDPGLLRIGWGFDQGTAVLDSGSLVMPVEGSGWMCWPYASMKNVPRGFRPELPNPVPGANQAEWGYPITLQACGGRQVDVVLELREGRKTEGAAVPCHFSTPARPTNPDLAIPNVFCLIPKATLKSNTTYTVTARPAEGATVSWSFSTAP
jgi:hypothetical protein